MGRFKLRKTGAIKKKALLKNKNAYYYKKSKFEAAQTSYTEK